MDRVRTIAGPAGRRAAIAATGADEVTVADAVTVVVRAALGVRIACRLPAWLGYSGKPHWRSTATGGRRIDNPPQVKQPAPQAREEMDG
jgi:hypothetical protein